MECFSFDEIKDPWGSAPSLALYINCLENISWNNIAFFVSSHKNKATASLVWVNLFLFSSSHIFRPSHTVWAGIHVNWRRNSPAAPFSYYLGFIFVGVFNGKIFHFSRWLLFFWLESKQTRMTSRNALRHRQKKHSLIEANRWACARGQTHLNLLFVLFVKFVFEYISCLQAFVVNYRSPMRSWSFAKSKQNVHLTAYVSIFSH